MTMSGPLPLPLHCPSHHDHSYQSGQSLVRCGHHHYHWSLHLILCIIIQWSALSKEDIQNNHCFMLKYLKHEISIFFEGERSVSTYLKFLLPSNIFWNFFMASPVKHSDMIPLETRLFLQPKNQFQGEITVISSGVIML